MRLVTGLLIFCSLMSLPFNGLAQVQTTIISTTTSTITGGGKPIQNSTQAAGTMSTTSVAGTSWSQNKSYDNVSIAACVDGNGPGTAYLTGRIGPGTATENEIARVHFSPPYTSAPSPTTLFTGLHLGPGTYFVSIAADESGTPISINWCDNENQPLKTVIDSGVTLNGDVLFTRTAPGGLPTYPPSDSYTLGTPSELFSITGLASAQQFPDYSNALRIAQLADGSSWKTLFVITNLDQQTVNYAFRFWDDNGNPLALPIAGGAPGSLSGSIPAGGSTFAETPGNFFSGLLEGWAEVASTGRIGILTIFRQSVPGRMDAEGAVTNTLSGARVFLPFDNTQGFTTGVAVANTNPTQTLNVSLLFQTDSGVQSMGSLSIAPHAHQVYVLPSSFPSVSGARGTVLFTASTPDIAVLGLRFSPGGSFTSLGNFQ